jgi:hypothetical protein
MAILTSLHACSRLRQRLMSKFHLPSQAMPLRTRIAPTQSTSYQVSRQPSGLTMPSTILMTCEGSMSSKNAVLYLLTTRLADIDHAALAATLISTRYTTGKDPGFPAMCFAKEHLPWLKVCLASCRHLEVGRRRSGNRLIAPPSTTWFRDLVDELHPHGWHVVTPRWPMALVR